MPRTRGVEGDEVDRRHHEGEGGKGEQEGRRDGVDDDVHRNVAGVERGADQADDGFGDQEGPDGDHGDAPRMAPDQPAPGSGSSVR